MSTGSVGEGVRDGAPPAHEEETFQPVAGILAFLLPGLGHMFLGEVNRGLLIGAGVLGLFAGGLFIGGVDVIDSSEDRWWFVGQAPVGPIAFAIDRWHQRILKRSDPADNDPVASTNARAWFKDHPPARTKSVGHANEIGSLYTCIAGMLNAVCIIDAVWHAPRRRRPAAAAAPRTVPSPSMP